MTQTDLDDVLAGFQMMTDGTFTLLEILEWCAWQRAAIGDHNATLSGLIDPITGLRYP